MRFNIIERIKLNALARCFYKMHGYNVPEDYKFQEAKHPQEMIMWKMAVVAYEFLVLKKDESR